MCTRQSNSRHWYINERALYHAHVASCRYYTTNLIQSYARTTWLDNEITRAFVRTTSPEIKRRSRHFEAGWDDVSPSLSLSHAHDSSTPTPTPDTGPDRLPKTSHSLRTRFAFRRFVPKTWRSFADLFFFSFFLFDKVFIVCFCFVLLLPGFGYAISLTIVYGSFT